MGVYAAFVVLLLVGTQEEIECDQVGERDILCQGGDTLLLQGREQLLVKVANLLLANRGHRVYWVKPDVEP